MKSNISLEEENRRTLIFIFTGRNYWYDKNLNWPAFHQPRDFGWKIIVVLTFLHFYLRIKYSIYKTIFFFTSWQFLAYTTDPIFFALFCVLKVVYLFILYFWILVSFPFFIINKIWFNSRTKPERYMENFLKKFHTKSVLWKKRKLKKKKRRKNDNSDFKCGVTDVLNISYNRVFLNYKFLKKDFFRVCEDWRIENYYEGEKTYYLYDYKPRLRKNIVRRIIRGTIPFYLDIYYQLDVAARRNFKLWCQQFVSFLLPKFNFYYKFWWENIFFYLFFINLVRNSEEDLLTINKSNSIVDFIFKLNNNKTIWMLLFFKKKYFKFLNFYFRKVSYYQAEFFAVHRLSVEKDIFVDPKTFAKKFKFVRFYKKNRE